MKDLTNKQILSILTQTGEFIKAKDPKEQELNLAVINEAIACIKRKMEEEES